MADDHSDDQNWKNLTGTGKSRSQMYAFRPESKPFVLEQVQGPGSQQRYHLVEKRVLVGRSDEAEIKIQSREVSRRHMLLTRNEGEYTVTDLQSHNGVYLNGVKIHSAILRDGDNLQIGDVVLIYHQGS